ERAADEGHRPSLHRTARAPGSEARFARRRGLGEGYGRRPGPSEPGVEGSPGVASASLAVGGASPLRFMARYGIAPRRHGAICPRRYTLKMVAPPESPAAAKSFSKAM